MPVEKPINDPVKAEIESYQWFHSIELPGGYVTPGRRALAVMKQEYANTFDKIQVAGRTVLDVGAWSGASGVEALRRGARKVTALDHYTWNHPSFRGKKAFDFVMRQTGHQIHAVDIDLDQPQLNLTHLGQFDVVLFLGVFYHLKDPLAGLRELSSLVREVMVLETHIDLKLGEEFPMMRFYPGAELNKDATNWWGPNVSCMIELRKINRFVRVEVLAPGVRSGRQVFHAWKK